MICYTCEERGRLNIVADHMVAGTPMCDKCYRGDKETFPRTFRSRRRLIAEGGRGRCRRCGRPGHSGKCVGAVKFPHLRADRGLEVIRCLNEEEA